jgi:flagellar motility protein MotE (MotC chaperone)
VLSLGTTRHETAPANEKLRALYAERQALERRIESLKLLKSGMDPDKYAAELEKLATELAVKSRQIREAEGAK